MIYWNPVDTKDTTKASVIEWVPTGGWNQTFSEEDKIKCTNLFFFFKFKKGFTDRNANTLAQMVIYKQKYNGMRYSNEQEYMLSEALRPVFNT